MRLVLKALNKDLVPIKKQVTKKGKTFMQTFYVKPQTTPPPPPQVVPSKISVEYMGNAYQIASTRPEGGVYVSAADHFDNNIQKALKIPEETIKGAFTHQGYTFIVHQTPISDGNTFKWVNGLTVTEATTGLRILLGGNNFKEVVEEAQTFLNNLSEDTLKEAVTSKMPVAELPLMTRTEVIEELSEYYTPERLESEVFNVYENMPISFQHDVTFDMFLAWASDIERIKTNKDLNKLKEEYESDPLSRAIQLGITYAAVELRDEALSTAYEALSDTDMVDVGNTTFADVEDWARNFENNLVGGLDPSDYGVGKWSGDDVIAYAIVNNMPLNTAQYHAESEAESDEKSEDRYFSVVSDYGVSWDYSELSYLGRWVNGLVRNVRDQAKVYDEHRKKSEDMPSITTSEAGDVMLMLHEKSAPYTDQTLYRGTTNKSWGLAKVGDIIPLGVASFTKDIITAKGFGHDEGPGSGFILTLNPQSVPEDNPVYGVDVRGLIDEAERDTQYQTVLEGTGVTAYAHEHEFILRAPALKIVGTDGRNISVEPYNMSILDLYKALFSENDRITAMERTFDYAMHEDVPELWESL